MLASLSFERVRRRYQKAGGPRECVCYQQESTWEVLLTGLLRLMRFRGVQAEESRCFEWQRRYFISKTEDLSFNILRVTNRSQHFIRSDRVVMRRRGAQYIFCSLRRCHDIPGTSQYNNDVLRILFRDSQFLQNILFGSGQITTYRQRPSHSMTSPQDLKPLIWNSDNYKI